MLQARRFQVVRSRWPRPDGQIVTHESVQHPGAVGIVPLLPDDQVCLIRNFRRTIGQWLVEIPAGTLESEEDPAVTARRELEEETGYRCRELRKIHEILMSPGILNERMHLFVATGLEPGTLALQPDEQIQTLIVPWTEALAMTADGRIQDAKSLVALLHYERLRRSAPS